MEEKLNVREEKVSYTAYSIICCLGKCANYVTVDLLDNYNSLLFVSVF